MRRTALALAAVAAVLPGCGGDGGGASANDRLTWGLADGLLRGPDAVRAATEAAGLGAQVVRVLVRWPTHEPQPGRLALGDVDAQVRALRDRGVRPLLVVTGAPRWAQDPADRCPDELCPPARRHEASFAAFTAELARRYEGLHGIEVLNEPNTTIDWHAASGPDPERYARILRAAARAIRAARPGVPVVFAGLPPSADTADGRLSPRTFLRRAYAAGARGSFDALGVHPYPHPDARTPTPALDKLDAAIDQVRAARDAAQDGETPLWVTEVGYYAGVPARGGLPDVPGEVSEEEQADALLAVYDHLAGRPDVELLLFWRVRDDLRAPREQGFGVFRGDWSPKPAAEALRERFG